MIVGNSRTEYLLMRALIYVFCYTGAGCVIYFFVALAIGGVPAVAHPFSLIIEIYGLLELTFYFGFFIHYRSYLQRPAIFPPPLDREERRALFEKAACNVPDMELFMRKWLMNAHVDDIRRENIKDWLLWALFEKQGPCPEHDAELEEYISFAEEIWGERLKPGRTEAKAVLLSFDEVPMMHRSLLFYGIVGMADNITALGMFALGFKYFGQPFKSFFTSFPFRPLSLYPFNKSAAPDLSYYCRPHTSKTHRPIVLMHGIGIGLIPYLPLLAMLPRDIGILMVEVLPVSSRITPQHPLMSDLMASVSAIIRQQGWNDFVYCGHSYGTLLTAPFLNTPYLAERMHSIVLLDPVAILLHLPNVAYAFTRRVPVKANEWQLYLVQTDANIASTLGRRFCWRESVLFREHFEGRKTTVIVGSKDNLINPAAIASYIYSGDVQHSWRSVEMWKRTMTEWTGENMLDLMWLDDHDHGQSFLTKTTLPYLVKVLTTHALITKEISEVMPQVEYAQSFFEDE